MVMKSILALPLMALAALSGTAGAVIPSLLDPPGDIVETRHSGADAPTREDWNESATERNKRIRAERERGLYGPNLVIGPVTALGWMAYETRDGEHDYFDQPAAGLAFSIRGHYHKGLGAQATVELATSPSEETRVVMAEAKQLFGPWARFQLEPALGYSRGWARIPAGQQGGSFTAHSESVHVGMDFTTLLGNRLQVPLTVGFKAGVAGDSYSRLHAKLAYAINLD